MLNVTCIGPKRGSVSPLVRPTPVGLPLANTMMKVMIMKMNNCWNCDECVHCTQETTDDVACCNCCEEGSFFEEYRDEYTLADLGNNWW